MFKFLKSILIAAVVLAVLVGIIIGLSAIGLPSWPFIFFLFYFTTIAGMKREKFLFTSIGGLIGMTVGFSQSFLTLLTNNTTLGLVGFLVMVILLIALMIDGRLKVIDTFCMFMVTVLTGYAGGLPAGEYLACAGSYAIAVALFVVILAMMPKQAPRKRAVASHAAHR